MDASNTFQITASPMSQEPSVDDPHSIFVSEVKRILEESFYPSHPDLKESHGLSHVLRVYDHVCRAVACETPPLPSSVSMEVKIAALLHDVDDRKYFPLSHDYENARTILDSSGVSVVHAKNIISMISLVSCSSKGNSVPDEVLKNQQLYMLYPRWADRLEAVGAIGVVRCYQYNKEHDLLLFSPSSPRCTTEEEVWSKASPDRFELYQSSGGSSADMISHFYDKLLHVARPPVDLVRNSYLIARFEESSKELVEVCLRFGRTEKVDEDYIRMISANLSLELI